MRMNKILFRVLILVSIHANAQNPGYEIYALKYAAVSFTLPLSALVLDAPQKDSMHADFLIWLVKGNNRIVLVDAGFNSDIEDAKDFGVINFLRPDSVLFKLNLQAKDVTDIILTHPHWDHADGVDLFPNSQVWIQKEDYNYCVSGAWQKNGKKDYHKRVARKLLELNIAGRLTLVDGDNKEILPGISVYTGSRHTYNSQYVLVKTGSEKIILASDNAYTYYNVNHLKSAPKDATWDISGYIKAIVRMKTLASDTKFIIPGHDPLVFKNFPAVAEGVARIK